MAEQRSPWYLGVDVGRAKAKNFCAKVVPAAATCDDSDTAWGFFGGYQFQRNYAVEAGYRNLGRAESSGPVSEVATELFEVDLVGSWPLGAVSLYGKVGLYRGVSKGGGAFNGISEHTATGTIAAGVQGDIDRNFGLRGEWQRYPKIGGGQFGSNYAIDVFRFGVTYKF